MLQNQEFSKLEATFWRAFEGRLKLTFSGTKTKFVTLTTAGVPLLTPPMIPPRKIQMFVDNEPYVWYSDISTHAWVLIRRVQAMRRPLKVKASQTSFWHQKTQPLLGNDCTSSCASNISWPVRACSSMSTNMWASFHIWFIINERVELTWWSHWGC